MSEPPVYVSAETEHRDDHDSPRIGRVPIRLPAVAAAFTAASVVSVALLRVAHNAPGSLSPVVTDVYGGATVAAWLGPALAVFVLAACASERAERVGLVFVGAFGLVGGVASAASVPAAAAIGGGVALAVIARIRTRRVSPGGVVVAATLLGGLALSLAGSHGIDAATVRPVGSQLALVGLAATPVFVRPRWSSLGLGVLAVLVVLAVAESAPFVTGAVLLVGGAVVGTPLVLVASAAAGSVATLVAAIRRRDVERGLGVVTLAAAGVPATLPRALAVGVGLSLLVGVGSASDRLPIGGARR